MQDGSHRRIHAVQVSRSRVLKVFTLQDIVCGRRAAALVVYNTVVGQRGFAFQMIAPAFLPEDFVVFVNVRVRTASM